MLSRFFIHRPIFASVVSIMIVLAGAVSLLGLPIAQFPNISPPTVTVSTAYPGANAVVVAETVATPIEQEVNGVENMIYMSSVCGNDGSYQLTVTFEQGTDLDTAQVQVQNRIQSATPKLPEEVKRLGVNTKKKSPDFALMISLVSPDQRYDAIYLTNYAVLRLNQGDAELAESHLRDMLALSPEDPRGHRLLAMILAKAGRDAEARAHRASALRLDPDFSAKKK